MVKSILDSLRYNKDKKPNHSHETSDDKPFFHGEHKHRGMSNPPGRLIKKRRDEESKHGG